MNDLAAPPTEAKLRPWRARLPGAILEFVVLLGFWLVLSGHYNAKFITFGVLSAALVTLMTNGLVDPVFIGADRAGSMLATLWRFIAYLPWLVREIVKANLQVVYLVLHPRMPIDPVLLQFDTRLRGHLPQVVLANSITITPGSVTVNLEDGRYTVHALVPGSVSGLVDGSMQNTVGAIFGQKEPAPPTPLWAHSLGELR